MPSAGCAPSIDGRAVTGKAARRTRRRTAVTAAPAARTAAGAWEGIIGTRR